MKNIRKLNVFYISVKLTDYTKETSVNSKLVVIVLIRKKYTNLAIKALFFTTYNAHIGIFDKL